MVFDCVDEFYDGLVGEVVVMEVEGGEFRFFECFPEECCC